MKVCKSALFSKLSHALFIKANLLSNPVICLFDLVKRSSVSNRSCKSIKNAKPKKNRTVYLSQQAQKTKLGGLLCINISPKMLLYSF